MPRTLSAGMTGDDVRNLQGLLNFHLDGTGVARLATDSIFGPKTRAAVVRFQQIARVDADGLVGPKTRSALVNVGSVSAQVGVNATQTLAVSRPQPSFAPRTRFGLLGGGDNDPSLPDILLELFQKFTQLFNIPLPSAVPPPPPSPPTTPVQVNVQGVVVQAGNQWSFNPFAPSPLVLGSQANVLFKIGGLPPIAVSPGVQFFKNGVGSPNGSFTGQGFIQIGPPSVLPFGDFDLLNPFVQGFLQKNSGQPGQIGFALGNQATWKLVGDTLGLFVNTQAVFAFGLKSGQGQPVAGQVFGGLQLDLVRLLRGN